MNAGMSQLPSFILGSLVRDTDLGPKRYFMWPPKISVDAGLLQKAWPEYFNFLLTLHFPSCLENKLT